MKKKIVIIASVAVIVIAGVFAAVYFGLNAQCRHDYYEHVVTKQATCFETGTEQIVCTECGYVKGEFSASALGHDLSEPTRIEPTHETDGGISEIKCLRCGEVVEPAVVLNRLRYVVVCLSLKSAGMLNGIIDMQLGYSLSGNASTVIGGAGDDKYFAEIANVDEEKRNCGYFVFEASVGETVEVVLDIDIECDIEWYLGDLLLSKRSDAKFVVAETDSVYFAQIYSLEKLHTVEVSSNVEGYAPRVNVVAGGGYNGGYYEGAKLQFAADNIDGYTFYCWLSNGEAVSSSQTFLIDGIKQNQNLTAIYKKLSKLSVVCGYGGSAYISDEQDASDGETEIAQAVEDRTYYLFAKADEGYEFAGWYDGNEYIGNELPQEYLMSKTAKTLTAKFIKKS